MTARQCPEHELNWRRHAGSGQNEAMPVPSRRLKELIEGTVDHHASQRWPALEEVTISWRGSYGYLTGYLSEDDDDTIKLCRIQYLGDDTEWAFAIWQASTGSYADAVLLDGHRTGHPNQALDTACTLYLASPGDQPAEPLKDLRGAALVAGTQEPFFLENATRWADALRDAGADVMMTERVGGHGDPFWQAEFPLMVAWAFRC